MMYVHNWHFLVWSYNGRMVALLEKMGYSNISEAKLRDEWACSIKVCTMQVSTTVCIVTLTTSYTPGRGKIVPRIIS